MASISERNGKFLVRVTRKGHPQINKTFTTRRDAELFAKSVEVDLERGVFIPNRGDRVTFRELAERYVREVTPIKRGADKEAYRLRALLRTDGVARPMLDQLVANLGTHHVATWRDARLKQVGASTLKREWTILAHVLEVARLDWGHEGITSPFRNIRKPTVRDARERRISVEELDAICAATQSTELEAFIRLSVETAARRGELLSLTWGDIDIKRRVAMLRQTKNGEARALPLSPVAVDLLRSIPRNLDGRVFTLRPDSTTQAFSRAVERARRAYVTGGGSDASFLVNLRLHDARHEACSRLAEHGFSALEVAAVSGHKTLQLLRRYTHMRPEALAEKLAAVAR